MMADRLFVAACAASAGRNRKAAIGRRPLPGPAVRRQYEELGEIDGLDGDNFRGARPRLSGSQRAGGNRKADADTWNVLAGTDPAPVLNPYTISDQDVAGPFTKAIPAGLEA